MNVKKDEEGKVEGCFQLVYCSECLFSDDCKYKKEEDKNESS